MRRLTSTLMRQLARFSNMKRIDETNFVTELPTFKINPEAIRPATREDKDIKIDQYEAFTKIKRSQKQIPQCRYYAVEYRNRIYHIFNAFCYPMGRMINKIATAIRGKNSPHYKNSIANIKNGDVCVIVNAVDPLFTRKKLKYKQLHYHPNFAGHLKTYSYRSILNKKPELLYYYLLRKAMPKNKLSEKYLENLKIFRGPNHTIRNLPQFMPPKSMRTPLSQTNFKQYLEATPDEQIKILTESQPGLTQKQLNRKFAYNLPPEPERNLDTDGRLDSDLGKKTVNKYNQKQIQKFYRRQKKLINRHKIVRAPYKKKQKQDGDFTLFMSEKEAKNSPVYDLMANEDLAESQDFKVQDPLKRKGWDKD